VFVYVGVHFQENPRSKRTGNIGPNRLYHFCYLLPFDLWTSYLARMLFLQGCGSLFWKFPSSTRIFNELQYNLQVWQGFINVSESFSYKDSLLILATSVLKPGPARRVDPGPGRPGPGTGPGGGKNPLGNWPGETRSTRDPVHPVKPG